MEEEIINEKETKEEEKVMRRKQVLRGTLCSSHPIKGTKTSNTML